MQSTQRVLVALVLAGLICSATSVARMMEATPRRPMCAKTYSAHMFARAARIVYHRTRSSTRSDREALSRYTRCSRTGESHRLAMRFWRHARRFWLAARAKDRAQEASVLAYGRWAIPAAIVMCESGGANLPPNSAGASGFYQIIPGTWRSYGGAAYASEAYLSAKPGQDNVAARIWQGGAGASQWVCRA